jgi:hypothetical protein
MAKFRKKPVVIEAVHYDGSHAANRWIIDWTRDSATPASMDENANGQAQLSLATLEGALWISDGDWVIRGVHGEFYPCKPDIFAATYEPAE